jgi:O-antigen ligase
MKNLTIIKDVIAYRCTLFCYFLLPVFSFFGPRSSVVIFSFLSLFSVAHFFENKNTYFNLKKHITNHKLFFLSGLLFLLWLSISVFTSSPLKEPLSVFFKFSSMLLLGGIFFEYIKSFSRDKKHNFLKALFLGCVAGAILLLVDINLGGKLGKIKQCEPARVYAKITLIISMIAPLALFYIKNPFLKLVWILFFMIMFYFGFCDTATLAFITACCLYYVLNIPFLKNAVYKYSGVIVFVFIMILPFGMKKALHFNGDTFLQNQKIIIEPSYQHRLEIWKHVIHAIGEKPIFGQGINSSKNDEVVGTDKKFIFEKEGQQITASYGIHHPHNYILQLWLELGGVGAFIWGLLTYFVLSHLTRYPARKPAILLFAASQIHLLFSISMWQTWWWAALYFIFPLLSVSNDE